MKSLSQILEMISETAMKVFANGGGEVYLYGSRARGDAKSDSDWDLLVVTEDAPDNDENFRKYAFPFARLGWDIGEQITPLLYSRNEWENLKGSSFYDNVTSEALRL